MVDITVEELVHSNEYLPVDVRSPIEHAEAAIPGAINIPLFTNAEREEIGILYKNEGSDAAKWRAMEIVSPKIPSLLGQIKDLEKTGARPVVYCWRGGSRSKSVATFLELSGIPSVRLQGGYRAYREYILEQISELLPNQAIILHGLTGTGKTDILKILQNKGYPVVDLEKLANHRGSLFGSIGMGNSFNQKTFDALLFDRLKEIKDSSFYIVEAESKRIGRAAQPEIMMDRKKNGTHFLIQCSLENRIERIYQEYVLPFEEEQWFQDEVLEKIKRIEKRLKKRELVQLIEEATINRDYKKVIAILFEHYYDPRYSHSLKDYLGDFTHIDGEDSSIAAVTIERELVKKVAAKIRIK